MRNFLILPVFFILFGCTKEKVNAADQRPEKSAAPQVKPATTRTFNLGKFGFPPDLEGCSCYFAENNQDFDEEKFIYIDDYGKKALIKVDNKIIVIPATIEEFDENNFEKNVVGNGFKIKLTGKKIQEMEEVMMFEGQITVQREDGAVVQSPLYGECGC